MSWEGFWDGAILVGSCQGSQPMDLSLPCTQDQRIYTKTTTLYTVTFTFKPFTTNLFFNRGTNHTFELIVYSTTNKAYLYFDIERGFCCCCFQT